MPNIVKQMRNLPDLFFFGEREVSPSIRAFSARPQLSVVLALLGRRRDHRVRTFAGLCWVDVARGGAGLWR